MPPDPKRTDADWEVARSTGRWPDGSPVVATSQPDDTAADWYRQGWEAGNKAAPRGPEDGLREAAGAVVDLTDDLDRWDELNKYVVNSQRDYLAGNLSAAWDRLRAALRSTPAAPKEDDRG